MATTLDDLDLRVYLDYPQPRKNRLGPYVFATDGSHLDDSTAYNCIIDPVTQSVFGTPLPMTPEWRTTATGNYARIQKSDYTFSAPSSATDWLDYDYRITGDTYLISASADPAKKSASIKLTGGVERNQPLFFSFSKLDKAESNSQYILKLFWQSTTEFPNYDTSLMFKSDGSVDVFRGYVVKSTTITFTTSSTTVTGINTKFNTSIATGGDGLQIGSKLYTKDGQLIGTVSAIGSDTSLTLSANPKFASTNTFWFAKGTTSDSQNKVKSYSRTENNFNANRTLQSISNPNKNFNDLYIIPCRGKDLLVMSSYGLNFCHTFDDLNDPYVPPSNLQQVTDLISETPWTSPVILPKGDFAIVIPTGNLSFQLARLKFLANWSILSKRIDVDKSYLPNSSIPIYATDYTNTEFYCNYTQDVTNNKKLKLYGGTSFDTALPVGTKVYASFSQNVNDYLCPKFIGKIASLTSSEITLQSKSLFFTNNTGPMSIIFSAPVTGTLSWNTASNTVTGTSTTFTTNFQVDDWIFDDNNRLIGQIKTITNNTSIILYDKPCFTGNGIAFKNIPNFNYVGFNYNAEFFWTATSTSDLMNLNLFANAADKNKNLLGAGNPKKTISPNDELYLLIGQKDSVNPTNSLQAYTCSGAFYSADYFYSLQPEVLNNTQIDITSVVEKLTLSRNTDGYMTANLSARKQLLIDLGVSNPDRMSNRSIKICLKPRDVNYQEITILEGRLSEPDIQYIVGANYDKYSLLNFNITDKKNSLNELFYSVAPSMEDKDLPEVFNSALSFGGFTEPNYGNQSSSLSFSTTNRTLDYALDVNRLNSSGQYNNLTTPSLGDSVGSYIERVKNDLINNYTTYVKNDAQFDPNECTYRSNSQFILDYNFQEKSVENITLYLNEITANTYGSIPIHKGYKRTIRGMQKTIQRPDANKITIIGIDKNNNDRITIIKENLNSTNPYILPANRSDAWLGEVKEFVKIDPNLTSLQSVNYAADNYFERLSNSREIIEFSSDFLTYLDTTTKIENPEFWRTGKLFWTTSQTAVTGESSQFLLQLTAGEKIYANGNTLIGTVGSVTTDILLQLSAAASTTGSSIKWTNKILTGTITTLDYSTGVTGVGTLFTTELAVNDYLYDPATGNLLGQVATITNNTSLTLVANATATLNNTLFTKINPFITSNVFKYIDLFDVVAIKDLSNNTSGNYKITGFNVEFIKDYTNATSNEIIVRTANYQGEKITLNSNVPVISVSSSNELYDNVMNLAVGYNRNMYLTFLCKKELTAALISPPSGMTILPVNVRNYPSATAYYFVLQWNPTSAFQNYVTTVELQLTPAGQTPVSFFYKFRVFSAI